MDIKKRLLNHPFNKHIKYLEEPHEYWYYPSGDFRKKKESVQFDGITGWIGSFTDKFDADKQARLSNKNPNSKWYDMGEEEIKKAWKKKGNDTRDKGTAIHKAIETVVNTGEYDEDMSFYIDNFWEAMDKAGIEPFVSEFVIYDKDIKRATPIDVVGVKDNKLIPIDIKSFEKGMEFMPYGEKRFNYPLDELYASKYEKVCLQVSIAQKWLSEQYELPVGEGYVLLLNDNDCDLMPTFNYISEIEKMYDFTEPKPPWKE